MDSNEKIAGKQILKLSLTDPTGNISVSFHDR
jgi:hypothetical protein